MFPSRSIQTDGQFELTDEQQHIWQSIRDILTTPIGSRIMLPEYGSELFSLLDSPMSASWKLRVYAATAEAIDRWEPRVKLRKVTVLEVGPGYYDLECEFEEDLTYQVRIA